ncbi:hypothetical protein HN018_26720 (plasmid) [Lichenicola cladoniae]|uniref:Uncharacterized protein n=1 Tax=Lichenicola cladoniae TaxID=1484109 RepID=A0A6M8HZU6_9PROT|nr:hypothetical protein [Lichenicola cladoniae]NPD66615.1 hypothetical protein [Acetobacteraceae bacterium]QKE93727.1 hypothetical protein HN018_26720 [Lichenicola cladoniae]
MSEMVTNDVVDPVEVVLNFLRTLPATDGGSLPALVATYAGLTLPEGTSDPDKLLEPLQDHLRTGGVFARTGRLIAAVAYVDSILYRWIDAMPTNRATANFLSAKDPDNPLWQRMRLAAPLREKHTAQMNERWQVLKQGDLNHAAIHAYSERLHMGIV